MGNKARNDIPGPMPVVGGSCLHESQAEKVENTPRKGPETGLSLLVKKQKVFNELRCICLSVLNGEALTALVYAAESSSTIRVSDALQG